MAGPLAFRCALTPALLDRASPEVAAALALWTSRRQAALAPLRDRLEPGLRLAGLGLSAAGALLSGWVVATAPEGACAERALAPFQVATPLFAALGVVFWFLPRATAALRAWAPRAAAARAPRLLAPLRRHLPTEVAYRLEDGRLASSLARPARTGTTALASVGGVVAGEAVACLFGRPPLARLLRVVWLPGPAEREALLAALGAAGAEVHRLPAAGEAGPVPLA